MGVVHIKQRVTRDQQEFQQSRMSDRSLLYVDRVDNAETYSLELNVGTRWSEKYGTNDNTMFELDPSGIDLPGRGSIVVEVADEITVPHNMYGIIVPTGSLFLDRGVIIAAAKIEPAFHGKLKLRLVNTLTRKVHLKPGDKVASAIFFGTETTEFQRTVTKEPAALRKDPPLSKRATHWLSMNRNQVISWIVQAITSGVAAAILMTFVFDTADSNADQPQTGTQDQQAPVAEGAAEGTTGSADTADTRQDAQGSRPSGRDSTATETSSE